MKDEKNSDSRFPWDFFLIAFAFSWLFWMPAVMANRGAISLPVSERTLQIIGAHGPFFAAFLLTFLRNGVKGALHLLKRGFNFKVSIKWISLIFALPIAIYAGSRYLYLYRGGNLVPAQWLSDPIAIIKFFLLMFFLGGSVQEEFGWRGYALDRIQAKHNALVSSLILGVIWGVWHLPVFFFKGTNQALMPFGLFLILTCSLAVLFTWFHNNNKGIIFVALLFHTTGNWSATLFPVLRAEANVPQTAFIYSVVCHTLAALLVVIIFGASRLSKKSNSDMPFDQSRIAISQ